MSVLAKATRDFSPPDSTLIFLYTSSLENKKHPSTPLNSISVFLLPA